MTGPSIGLPMERGAVRGPYFRESDSTYRPALGSAESSFEKTRVSSLEEGTDGRWGDKMGVYSSMQKTSPPIALGCRNSEAPTFQTTRSFYQSVQYCDKTSDTRPDGSHVCHRLVAWMNLIKSAVVKPYGVDAQWSILSKHMIDECHRPRNQGLFRTPSDKTKMWNNTRRRLIGASIAFRPITHCESYAPSN